ncbi:MAG: DMT family transporter [bacterium]|nr:DMT family transporter [bacterium]
MLLVSSASIIIRFTEAPPLIIAFYRVLLASLLIFAFQAKKTVNEIKVCDKNTILISAAAGLFLALHFASFIISLEYTTIANSVILVDSAPLFALLLSYLLFKESAKFMSVVAVIIALAGAVIIGWGDVSTDPELFRGDLYAVAGAVFLAVYLVCGRKVRSGISLTPYLVLVYGFAAMFLWLICMISGVEFFGYSGREYFLFTLLALLPTIGGHSLFLYTIKYLKAYVVNLGFLGELVGAAILAFIFFREAPVWYFYVGGLLIFGGLIFVIINEEKSKKDTVKV